MYLEPHVVDKIRELPDVALELHRAAPDGETKRPGLREPRGRRPARCGEGLRVASSAGLGGRPHSGSAARGRNREPAAQRSRGHSRDAVTALLDARTASQKCPRGTSISLPMSKSMKRLSDKVMTI